MKYRVLITALTASLIGITAAQAQPMHDKGELFAALDTDNSGQLDRQELSNMRETMAKMRFKAVDTNGDGKVGKAEFMARAEQRAERMFKQIDKDGNGSLDANEAQSPHHGKKGHRGHDGDHDKRGDRDHAKGERHEKMFERMDRDSNGSVSRNEFDQAMTRHAEGMNRHKEHAR